jgi:hypothetical protein
MSILGARAWLAVTFSRTQWKSSNPCGNLGDLDNLAHRATSSKNLLDILESGENPGHLEHPLKSTARPHPEYIKKLYAIPILGARAWLAVTFSRIQWKSSISCGNLGDLENLTHRATSSGKPLKIFKIW